MRPASPSAQWVHQVVPRLWRFLRRIGCDRTAAEDLAQDAVLAALEGGVDRLEEPAAMSWLHATARNLFRAHLRAKGRRPQLSAEVDCWPDAQEFDERSEQLQASLRRCVLQLTSRARRALELRYRHGASRQQIAGELGVRDSGVKTLLQRTREQLRTCVERQSNDT